MNWGLGHATRSMPIIDQLVRWNANVILAGDGRSLHLLRAEYPNLKSVELPSYKVRYTSGAAMVAITVLRTPMYLTAIFREHRELNRLIGELNLDMVISDNRYGMWSSKIPSVFMCHQLAIIPPDSLDWMTPAVHQLHKRFYSRFDEVWIPDFEGRDNLTGRLTHNHTRSSKEKFTGPLSRFMSRRGSSQSAFQAKYVVVLSGPEPQRSLLEREILAQARNLSGEFLIVQGKTESFSDHRDGNVRVVSYLNAEQLYGAMSNAEVVISRSGYSTVMDLCFLGKPAVFIPTPGQTEQEYLADKLQDQGMAVVQDQKEFDLEKALQKIPSMKGFPLMEGNNGLEGVMHDFISRWDITKD